MEQITPATLISSAVGAVVGFVLAQLVNLAKLLWWLWERPRLSIEAYDDDNLILSHSEQGEPHGEWMRANEYGFKVENKGRSVAPSVRFHLLRIEVRDRKESDFRPAMDGARELFVYAGANAKRGGSEATIVPGGSSIIHLASWREDHDAVFPAIASMGDYYEEGCQHAAEYRFTVVAFAEGLKHATKTLTVKSP